jgi:signal-transduction protein with cAMP-binding, CBS, and nucleotidyltransferase domain
MQSQTKIFSCLVKDFMTSDPVMVPSSATVEEVLGAMTEKRATCILVTDSNQTLVGIFTEKDVTRRVALRCEGSERIAAVMTTPVRKVKTTDYLYHAIARMRRYGHRHMPVVDADNRPAGIVDLHDAIAVASEQLIGQIDRLTQEGTMDGLREVKAAQVELAEQLMADSLPAPEIQALLTHINNDIYRRIVELSLSDMKAEGLGEPPVPFEMIVLGSSGRGENFLFPDQDNGFILDEYPNDRHNEIDAFFIEVADRTTQRLAEVGIPLCRGYVMATNPLWRKTLPQWIAQTTQWFQKRIYFMVQLSDIFFDLHPVYGEGVLARSLRRHVLHLIQNSPAYLQAMFETEGDRHVALGLFGGLRKERDNPTHRGKINLKHGGLMPLVGSVRLLSLKQGFDSTPTLDRITRLHELGVLDEEEVDNLRAAFDQITEFLLRQQLRDFRAGRGVSNFVPPSGLTGRERRLLVNSLKAIDSLQKKVRMEFTADLF